MALSGDTAAETRPSAGARPARPGRIRPVLQMERADCGAACLTMLLSRYGKHLPLSAVRALLDGGRDGVTALDIVRAGRHFGLEGGGFAAPLALLPQLPPGSILHWEAAHFVVLLRADASGALILDPARGRRKVSAVELARAYSGVALVLEPAEGFVAEGRPSRGLATPLARAVWSAGRWGPIALSSLALQGLGLGLPLIMGLLIDRVVPAADRSLWELVCWATLALVIVHPLVTLARGRLLLALRARLDADLGARLMHQLTLLPYSFFMRRPAGDLIMRLQSNVAVRQILSAAALSALMDATLMVTYTALMAWAAPSMAALVIALGALQLVMFVLTRARRRELLSRSQAANAAKTEFETQLLANMETVKSAGAEARAEQRWSALFEEALSVEAARGWLEALNESFSASVRTASPLIVLVYGVDAVLSGEMSLGAMLSLNALAVASLAPLAGLVSTASQLSLLGGYLERIEDVMQSAPEQDAARVAPAPPLRGEITLEQVRFRFSPLLDDTLRGVDLTVPAGSFVAVVGPSGAGKSTLARLLSGLHVPSAGRVLYDGLDLSTLDLSTVRRQIGVVTQRPELLGSSVLDALRFAAPDATEADVIEACRSAAIHDEIAALPMGYQTGLASGGSTFSGGQTQRLALARALVARPRIVILDEATSALDGVAERQIQRALEALDCTRIVLAHRLSTVRRADRIVVMEHGQIVETGTHDELIRAGGTYVRLMGAQLAEAGDVLTRQDNGVGDLPAEAPHVAQ